MAFKPWKKSIGRKPHTVTAFERPDKDNTVWLRWSRPRTGKYDKMSLGTRIRDAKGRLDRDRVDKVVAIANRASERRIKGEDPRTPEMVLPTIDGALSIAEGLRMALMIPDGMYPVDNDHARDMKRYQDHVIRFLPSDVSTWAKLTTVTYETLWKNIAHWRVKEGVRTRTGEIVGRRAAELAVILLAQAGRWLKGVQKIPLAPEFPKEKWHEKLVADWSKITKQPMIVIEQPRHSTEELGHLFRAVDRGAGDPRIRLALKTAAEARLGQAIRCDRRMLDLNKVGAHGLGRFTIPDTGKKLGVLIDLNPAQRAAWDHEMRDGYLGDLEAAFQAGFVKSYPLFPAGRLRRGRARSTVTIHLGDRAALDMFHELERLAGVAIVEGRGWYGVRRIAADLCEDVEKDGRALNAITGHSTDDTRRLVYQQKQRDQDLEKASTARHAARQLAIDAANAEAPADSSPDADRPSVWERRKRAKRERRLAAHPVPTGRKKGGRRAKLAQHDSEARARALRADVSRDNSETAS